MLKKLIEQTLWANARWIAFVYDRPLEDRPRRLVAHLLLAERAWFDRLAGREPGPLLFELLSRDELDRMLEVHRVRYAEVLGGDLDRVIEYRRFSGEAFASPVSDILLHLVTHAFHHRGQLSSYYAGQGVACPRTDFIQYCRAPEA
ncbi:MAG: hypothetical protein HS116_21695 [Planctomycetes bacterium]|nr:hypothetical protein [Planctomycetota bacterium]